MGPSKKKYPSGASKRKLVKQRSEALQEELATVSKRWINLKSDSSLASLGELSRKPNDPNGPAVELPIYGVPPPVLVRVVNSALNALEQGQFFQPSYLLDGMTRDAMVNAKLNERIQRLIGVEMEIKPAKDTARARKIAEDLDERFTDIFPSFAVGKLLRNGLMLGVGIAQVLTERTVNRECPLLYTWNNRNLRWDWTIRRYCMVTQNRGEIVLDPDDPEWVIYEPYGPYGWRDAALVRSIALPWIIRYWSITWWARHQEILGTPIRLGIIPATRDPKDERTFLTQLANLGTEATIRLPQGAEGNKFDVRLLEAPANAWEGFLKLLEHADDDITISLLGQRQSTKGQGGLGSQENAGESTILRLTRSDALIYEVLRDEVIYPWTENNYGDGDLSPWPTPQIEPPADEAKVAETDLKIGQALTQFKSSGAPIDSRKFLEARGYGDLLMDEKEQAAMEASNAQEKADTMAAVQAQDQAAANQKNPDTVPANE